MIVEEQNSEDQLQIQVQEIEVVVNQESDKSDEDNQ
jgi:hypothetical protein